MARFSRYLCEARLKKAIPYVRGRVPDLGCGPATILELLSALPEVYVGVEWSQSYLTVLREKYPQYTLVRRNVDDETLDLEDRFDTILMTAVIEHIFNQKHFFQQALRHLAPWGKLIVTTPTPFGDWVHQADSQLGWFASAADDRHIIIYTHPRFDVPCKEFHLRIEKFSRFELGCNQLVVLSVREAAA